MKLINLISVLIILVVYLALFFDAESKRDWALLGGFSLLDLVFFSFIAVFILQAAITPKVLDLEEQFSFYSSYHDHLVNKLIHLVMIWPIVWTGMVLFSGTTPLPIQLPQWAPFIPDTLPWGSTALCALSATYFLLLDPKSGPITAAMTVGCFLTATTFREMQGDRALTVAAALHALAWVGQFIGHGVFERRAPSLLNNLAQSVLMAPHFVFLEACFMMGCRRDLFDRTRPNIIRRIKALNAAQA